MSERHSKTSLVVASMGILLLMSLPSVYYSSIVSGPMVTASVGFNISTLLDWQTIETSVMDAAGISPANDADKELIAVIVCTRSKPDWEKIQSTSLYTLLIPSVEKTVTDKEWEDYRVEIVVGFDQHDTFWENPKNLQDLVDGSDVPLNFLSIPKKRAQQIPFNQACRAAYEYGADYIVRVNDDSEFLTSEWITKGIQKLSSYHPTNLGVVGPTCHQGNTAILTHDMVHRTHLDIFADYYPDEFDNWWIDDWITSVYGPNRTEKMADWSIHHHTGKHGTRYKVTHSQQRQLSITLDRGKKRISEFLRNPETEPGTYQVLGTPRLSSVWGPMAAYHSGNATLRIGSMP